MTPDPARVSGVATRRFTDRLVRVVEQFATAVDARLPQVSVLTVTELAALRAAGAGRNVSADLTFGSAFERWVTVLGGGTVAVVDGSVAVSYAELNRRANRLARWLVTRGVGPEVGVAVGMERGADWGSGCWPW